MSTIKFLFFKKLQKSDVNTRGTLHLHKRNVERYILPCYSPEEIAEIHQGEQKEFIIVDLDSEESKEEKFVLRFWKGSSRYILKTGWYEFVKRRNLQANNVIIFFVRRDTNTFFMSCSTSVKLFSASFTPGKQLQSYEGDIAASASADEGQRLRQENSYSTAASSSGPGSERNYSASSSYPQLYDVFISHRGPDVKHTLASQLYSSLQRRRCRAFLDKIGMKGGDSIRSTIHDAINSSSVQIAIFSRGYAQSEWCLDELLLMLNQTKALFIPVFYEVKPGELRHIETGVYAEAFSKYERKGRCLDKLDDWKRALHNTAGISGYELSEYGQDLCDTIVSAVGKWIEARRPLHVATHPVGLDERVKDFDTFCGEQKSNKTVGIFGFGGSGKTTLAKELFNRKRSNYKASCFLNDVRDASAKGELHSKQTKLLKDLFGEDCQFDNTDEGSTHLTNRLKDARGLRLLIVLDDIDHHVQLDVLSFTDMQSPNNLVIVTTRDERVLTRAKIRVHYNMKLLEMPRATELFCWHAFLQPVPDIGYKDLVKSFVEFCGGLPLSLKLLGAHVRGSNDREYWRRELEKVKKTLPEDIIQRLKISFDSLDGDEKQIFMDIACFFLGEDKEMAIRIWKGSGWSAEHALQTLTDRSLVEMESGIRRYGKVLIFRMHDHLRDLGRLMAENLRSPPRLWKLHDLRSMESKGFKKILAETNGRCFHRFEDSSIGSRITYFIGNANDCADTSTVPLWLDLHLQPESTLKTFPSWLSLKKLQGLCVHGPLQGLWDPNLQNKGCRKRKRRNYTQANFELKQLELQRFDPMLNLSKLIGMLNHLESLVLTKLPYERGVVSEGTSLSHSLKMLGNLTKLVLDGVELTGEVDLSNNTDSTHSNKSSTSTCMNSLETIKIYDGNLSKLLISGEICPSLQCLILSGMDDLIGVDLKRVKTLNSLSLSGCHKLKTISGLSDATELVTLSVERCSELEELPTLVHLTCLQSITITGACHTLHSIAGIEELEGLKRLHLEGPKGCKGVWNCIYGMKRLPSEVTGVVCFDTEESSLNASLFCGLIDDESVIDIHGIDRVDKKLKMSGSMSAIVLCVRFCCTGYYGHISTPWFDIWIKGEGIVTIVATDRKEIDRYDAPRSILGSNNTVIEGGYIVILREGEEWRTLEIFKRIIEELYL